MQTITQMTQLSALLKNLRKDQNLSQAELGAKVGLSQARMSVMENHPERLTVDNFFTLLVALDAKFAVGPKATAIVESKIGQEISPAGKRSIRNSIDVVCDPKQYSQDLLALAMQNSNIAERIQELTRKLEGFNKLPANLSKRVLELATKVRDSGPLARERGSLGGTPDTDKVVDNRTKRVSASTHTGYTNSRTIDKLAGNKKESW